MRDLVRALLRDRAGNTLMFACALLIPITALIGSGVDVGRVYVARARIQQACDAASLAGRWAVSAGQSTTNVSSEALKYFNFNFKQGIYGTAAFTPAITITGASAKTVKIVASTTLPLTIMRVFGFQPMTVAATCEATQDFVNTDIVLVLDTTGSMADKATPGDTQSKIAALRAAVLALYDQLAPIQTQLEAAGMRLRYSVLPYASTVNVGRLIYAVKPAYILDQAPYKQAYCASQDRYGNCTAVGANTVIVPHSPAWLASSSSWPGCIEERQTTSAITTGTSTIPAAAYDLDFDTIPSNNATRWPPYDTSAEQANSQTACPVGAKRLQAWTRSNLSAYLDTLVPDGGTYHDIGMEWAGRMISSGGIFADSPTTFNGMPVNKFIIFMTDGLLDTGPTIYSAYGAEWADQRITGGDAASQDARHQQRFNLLCGAVKNRGVSVWVVAFAATADSNLTNCASNVGQVSNSANSADLIQRFIEIGKNIGALRLTR